MDEMKNRIEAVRASYGWRISIPEKDALSMFGDAPQHELGENYQFFLNQNNPTISNGFGVRPTISTGELERFRTAGCL